MMYQKAAHIKQTQNHDVPKTYKFVFIFVVQAISPNKGCPPLQNLQVFYNIVQKAFAPPPPLRFEHYVANYF